MTEQEEQVVMQMATALMNGLIVKGTVRAGEETDKWNVWCIKKAYHMYKDAQRILRK